MALTIHEACQQGDLEMVRSLLSADPASVDADDQYQWRPVFHAALRRHTEVVRLLIEAGADLAAHDGYVLHYAGQVPGNQAIMELLIRYGALEAHVGPKNDLSRQLLAALFLSDRERVRSLLVLHPELAATVDGRGDYPIHHAARSGDAAILQLLVDSGADVNAVGANGNTVLYCAGGHGHLEAVQLLLGWGADVDVPFTEDGKDLLAWLAQYPDDSRYKGVTEALIWHRQRHVE